MNIADTISSMFAPDGNLHSDEVRDHDVLASCIRGESLGKCIWRCIDNDYPYFNLSTFGFEDLSFLSVKSTKTTSFFWITHPTTFGGFKRNITMVSEAMNICANFCGRTIKPRYTPSASFLKEYPGFLKDTSPLSPIKGTYAPGQTGAIFSTNVAGCGR